MNEFALSIIKSTCEQHFSKHWEKCTNLVVGNVLIRIGYNGKASWKIKDDLAAKCSVSIYNTF